MYPFKEWSLRMFNFVFSIVVRYIQKRKILEERKIDGVYKRKIVKDMLCSVTIFFFLLIFLLVYLNLQLFYPFIHFVFLFSFCFFFSVFHPWTRGHSCFSNRRCRLYWLTCYPTTFEGFLSCHHSGMSYHSMKNFSD